MKKQSSISPFKSYLKPKTGFSNATYVGGKAIGEVKTKADKLYKLSSNENALGASPKALETLKHSLKDIHIYPDRTTQRLQLALESFYEGALSSDQFICANSGSEVIEHIIRAFLGEGHEYIVSNPCFKPYEMFSAWQGAKMVDVPLLEPDYRLDIEGILSAVTDRTRLLFLTSPNNPTGTHIPHDQLANLLDHLPAHVVVVLDEVYYHFADAEDYSTALAFVKEGKQLIAVNSFSKTYGLASLRVGYAYTTPELAGYLRQLSRPFLLNSLTLNAAIAALGDTDFVQEIVHLVQTERNRLYPLLDDLPIRYWKSQANFILMKAEKDSALMEDLLLSEGIMVRDVTNFGAPGCFRVTIGTPEANDALIAALQAVL